MITFVFVYCILCPYVYMYICVYICIRIYMYVISLQLPLVFKYYIINLYEVL